MILPPSSNLDLKPNGVQKFGMVGDRGQSIRRDEPTGGHCWNANAWKDGIAAAQEACDGSVRHWEQALASADGRAVGAALAAQVTFMCQWCAHQSHFAALSGEAWPQRSFHGLPQHLQQQQHYFQHF